MYDELVKRLRNAAHWADKGLVIVPSVCLEAADAIEELSGFVQEAERDRDEYRERLEKANELMQKRWIPVTERLPEERQFVLAWKDEKPKGFICISCWMVDAGWAFKHITHWMPLPRPPKEESL